MKYEEEMGFEKLDFVLDKLTDYALAKEDYQVLIYGDQSKSFYRGLARDKDIELLWTGKAWSKPPWTTIFSFLTSGTGLVRIKNKKRIKELYNYVGEQSFCALCFVDGSTVASIVQRVTKSNERNIEDLIENSDGNLMLKIDFDYGSDPWDPDELYKIAYVGQNVDPVIVMLLSEK